MARQAARSSLPRGAALRRAQEGATHLAIHPAIRPLRSVPGPRPRLEQLYKNLHARRFGVWKPDLKQYPQADAAGVLLRMARAALGRCEIV